VDHRQLRLTLFLGGRPCWLVSRFKEEIHAGINTGIIRSMAGSGSVVTAAGLF
jgi:uncharacterized membrane protein YdfJ with MMPL/SSD domain